MVEITLLEVDLADAEFNAPFARSSGGEPMRGLRSVVGEVTRSVGSGSDEAEFDVEGADAPADSPGRGLAMVGAFFVLLTLAWLLRRSRREASTGELAPVEA